MASAPDELDGDQSAFLSGAEFSPCRRYRYALWRRWGWNGEANQVMFIGLNPSRADERRDDPTLRRCIGFAKAWGYNGLLMLNAYAFCATQPSALKAVSDPIGPANDAALRMRRRQVGLIVAAWGRHCGEQRAEQVHRALNFAPVMCLGTNRNGTPRHPLYLKADAKLERHCLPSEHLGRSAPAAMGLYGWTRSGAGDPA